MLGAVASIPGDRAHPVHSRASAHIQSRSNSSRQQPAGEGVVEMIVEFRPALGFERFVERTFALDRAGHLNAKGRGSPLRLATAGPHEAEFFVPRVPIGLQRAILRALDRLGQRLPGARLTTANPRRVTREAALLLGGVLFGFGRR